MQRREFLASLLATAGGLVLPETRRVYSFFDNPFARQCRGAFDMPAYRDALMEIVADPSPRKVPGAYGQIICGSGIVKLEPAFYDLTSSALGGEGRP